jgi:hypothetical protein
MGEAKRKREAVLNAPCPCGLLKPARDCCFNGKNWHKPSVVLGLAQLPATAVVDKCYMRELNSCVAPISGEHIISKSVIEVLQGNSGFSISGVPWLQAGEEKIIGPQSLRANCLCTKHNSMLSPIDDAAHYLFSSLKTYLEVDNGPRHALLSGHDIERWLLKSAKAMAVSGNLARGNKRLTGVFARDLAIVEMLDNAATWPKGAGLYCLLDTGDMITNHQRFQLVPLLDDNDQIEALEVSILGLIFVLLLEPLHLDKYPLLTGAKYRPSRIVIKHPMAHNWVTLSWNDDLIHEDLTLQFVQNVPRTDIP